MRFANPVTLARLTQPPRDSLAMPSIDFSTCTARIGSGGRLILSRCQPFTRGPLVPDQQTADEAQQRPAFDLTVPYAAAEAEYLQEQRQQLPRQQSHGGQSQGHSRQPSPGGQVWKAPQLQQAGSARTQAASHAQSQGAVPGQPPQPSASPPPAGQQTRQQPRLIEMPSQPGANLNGPSPPKSKVLRQSALPVQIGWYHLLLQCSKRLCYQLGSSFS